MKAAVLSALVLLLFAAELRADPHGVVERITKNGAAIRDSRTGLAALVVLSQRVTDADLVGLCELRRLRKLILGGTQVTDDDLRTVAALPQVSELYLVGATSPTTACSVRGRGPA